MMDAKRQPHQPHQPQQRLKTLRHPNLVKFQWVQNEGEVVSLVTEAVTPLTMDAMAAMPLMERVLGLFSLLCALDFLHARAGLSHNSVGLGAVFVAVSSGTWKLGLLDHALPPADMTLDYLRSTKVPSLPLWLPLVAAHSPYCVCAHLSM